jgi:hypothetical protein
LLRSATAKWDPFREDLGKTCNELLQSGQRKDINKKLHPVDTLMQPGDDKYYGGPLELMVIDPSENLTAWERMQKRLTDAHIIQDVLQRTEELFEQSGAKKVKQRVDGLGCTG